MKVLENVKEKIDNIDAGSIFWRENTMERVYQFSFKNHMDGKFTHASVVEDLRCSLHKT